MDNPALLHCCGRVVQGLPSRRLTFALLMIVAPSGSLPALFEMSRDR
ncbi:MAG: hypothetical protein KDA81_05805 [Planctomycetaceae bacterium]|nr:hypothetical protein [Planctomycetaceae bacterium]